MSQRNSDKDNPWKAAGLVGGLATEVVVLVLAGYFIGSYISRLTGGGKSWIIGGVLTGLALGIAGAALTVKRFLEDSNG
ncbi:AtpZ/AtpI family protein [Gorillibacterium massiliense]|uniref:AtpZ/AtpI family protein n=1 Tax=Gorillibacterium massiliense TaxID=1280390 RepID=UPI0004B758BD|nr:AtpZ/AtpI family protein [Gorillibacterium massiliense]